ncbi:Uncharacterised protein [uncultured archaeon]|nr:Uncharacterised protein [uncultured archaeon]
MSKNAFSREGFAFVFATLRSFMGALGPNGWLLSSNFILSDGFLPSVMSTHVYLSARASSWSMSPTLLCSTFLTFSL